MGTESRNPRSRGLDKMSASEIVRLMNEEETAVQKALTFAESGLAQAIEQAAATFKRGGRIFYAGYQRKNRNGRCSRNAPYLWN